MSARWDEEPEPSSPFAAIDAPLRATIQRSFVDRRRGAPGADHNLDVAWYTPGSDPQTAWEALGAMGAVGVNTLVRIYERVLAIDGSGGLWGQIRYLCNHWFGGSAGFKVVWEDPARAAAYLDALGAGRRVARDLLFASLWHQDGGSALAVVRRERYGLSDLLSPRPPPDADTWREVTGLGREALHFCVGKRAPRALHLDDVHLDWRSPVKGVDAATGFCAYDFGIAGALHYLQATTGAGKPVDPFDRVPLDSKWRLAVRGRAGYDAALRLAAGLRTAR